MKKSDIKLDEIKLVGVTMRTRNSLEINPKTASISQTIENYFGRNLSQKINNKKKPGVTICAYTDYESDENEEYTYFVGEEVSSFESVDLIFSTLIIPASDYAKFECGPGQMPAVCFDAWEKIWKMNNDDFGGQRTYITDFEIYDERAQDSENTFFDIYIGVKI